MTMCIQNDKDKFRGACTLSPSHIYKFYNITFKIVLNLLQELLTKLTLIANPIV
jgi:hypothetical protein